MLDQAGFALLVLTAESERTDGVVLARQNVVHEAGLFQGRLGWRKAIVLREDGCEEFSNIAGLGQIPFPNGNIGASFEEVRRVSPPKARSRNDARRRGSRNCCQLVRT
jgi:predicted nucleotide-binding protein